MGANLTEIKSQLQAEYGTIHEYSVDGYLFLYRPLKIKELAIANEPGRSFIDLEDLFVKTVTLCPTNLDLDDIPAGLVTRYADDILRQSGFEDIIVINEMLTKHRVVAENNIIFMMKVHIITAMPAYKMEDFDDLSMDQLVGKLVMAEKILSVQTTLGTSDYSTEAFKLYLSEVGAETPAEQAAPPPPSNRNVVNKNPLDTPIVQPKKGMSEQQYEEMRKNIIDKIVKQNRDTVHPTKQTPVDYSKFEGESLESLNGMLGLTKPNDPIAERLAGNRGREARVARSLGLPYDE